MARRAGRHQTAMTQPRATRCGGVHLPPHPRGGPARPRVSSEAQGRCREPCTVGWHSGLPYITSDALVLDVGLLEAM